MRHWKGPDKPCMPMKAIWNSVIIAQSDDIIELEGNAYFPMASLDSSRIEASNTTTVCGWKGEASYLTLVVGEERNIDAAWFYPDPLEAASNIRNRVAFWRGVQVVSV